MKAGVEGSVSDAKNPYAGMIAAGWERIEPRLRARDPMGALAEWGRQPETVRHALASKVEDWFVTLLANQRTAVRPWPDAQGLARLSYWRWPEIPTRSFQIDALPDFMAALAEYESSGPATIRTGALVENARVRAGDGGLTDTGGDGA